MYVVWSTEAIFGSATSRFATIFALIRSRPRGDSRWVYERFKLHDNQHSKLERSGAMVVAAASGIVAFP
jgi:hypothetical protein